GVMSYGSLSLSLAQRIFPDLTKVHVLLIGAGKISKLAGAHLHKAGATDICVMNRNAVNGHALAAHFGGRHLGLDQLRAGLAWADLVVTSTACPHAFITSTLIRDLPERAERPLCLIDL